MPVLAGNGWLALRYTWGDTWWLPETGLALLVVLSTLIVAWRVSQAPLPPAALVALALGVAAVVHTQLRLAGGPETLRDYNSYAIGLAAWAVTLCAFYVPLGWSLLLSLPLVAVVFAHSLQGQVSLGDASGAMIAALAPPVLGHVVGAYLRWSRRQQDDEQRRLGQLAAQVHRRQLREALGGRQLARARRVVGPWLREAAEGRLDLHDTATASRARALAVSLRDDLHAPGVLDDVLCARIDRARGEGTEVVIEATNGEPEQTGPFLRLLDRVLDRGTEVERVQVRLPEHDRPRGEVTVLPPMPPIHLSDLLRCLEGCRHAVRHDLFSTTVVLGDIKESQDAVGPEDC